MDGRRRYGAVGGGMGWCGAAGAAASSRPIPPPTAPDVHAEYVKFPSAGGATITGYLAYPERKDRAPGVVVIHEIFGLSDWIRQTTEQLARDGFVALAPDLLSRRGGTPPSSDDAHGWGATGRRSGGEAGGDRLPLRSLPRGGARIPAHGGKGRGG